MTTNHTDDMTADEQDRIVERGLEYADKVREQVKQIEQARDEQPERLAAARDAAEQARGWALLEEPLDGQVKSIASIDGTASLSLPNITARELWGARLAFDLIDCGDDFDQIDAVISRLFAAANGDTGIAMVIMSAALSTTASLIVPQLLDEIEHSGSNYDARVMLAEARAKAWHGRVDDLRGPQDDAADRGANALDPDADGR